MTNTKSISHCSFCNKHKDQVRKLIVGHDVAICNECVDLCESLLKDNVNKHTKSDSNSVLDPVAIKDYLDQYVVGQDTAKIALSVAIVNHYKRISSADKKISKANILMIGPTGTGKTLMAKTVSRYLDVPFVIADATCLTEAGYVGDDVESLISRLYTAAGGDVERTQRGIVFLDEVDKIARKSEGSTVSRDVSGEGVQQALLKLVEGTRCKIPATSGRKFAGSETIEIDTTNILFIAGGAFVGLDNIVKNRTQGSGIGFNSKVVIDNQDKEILPDDVVKFGMIPEFVGRFPVQVELQNLDKTQLIDILTRVKNNFIEQYQWLFTQDGVDLSFESESLECIVDRTIKTKTGARGLHSELERILLPHMYNLQKYKKQNILKIIIDRDQVNTPRTLLEGNQ